MDGDLPPQQRFDAAINILKLKAHLDQSEDPETLGLAGAIFKRRWALDGRIDHLRRALSYYRRGHRASFALYDAYRHDPHQAQDFDHGYNGINVAYILELLADLEEQEASETHMQPPACVPGVFEPLALDGLFPDMTVRLVDGSVHDNQGVFGLQEQNCDVMLVSDASGQTEVEPRPSSGTLGVLKRANNILMARVREEQYRGLEARRRAGMLRGLMFIHLKKDLDSQPVNWVGSSEPPDHIDRATTSAQTNYGIHKQIQRRLAAIRTDLDTFTDAEAFALMASGYSMTECEFAAAVPGFPIHTSERLEWPFLEIASYLTADPPKELLRQLDVSKHRFFKMERVWWTGLLRRTQPSHTAAPDRASAALRQEQPAARRSVRQRKTPEQLGVGIFLGTVGWLAGRVQSHIDRRYLRQGKLDRLSRK